MEVRVISVFCDKYTGEFYNPGEVIEVEDESRVRNLESRGFAVRVESTPKPKED